MEPPAQPEGRMSEEQALGPGAREGGSEPGLGAAPLGTRGFMGADHRVWTHGMRAGQRPCGP